MSRGLSKFLIRAALLSAPMVLIVGVYLVRDPFRVVRHYDFGDYYDEAAPVELNRDYVSLELFRKYNPQKHFDAFVFGSSRTFPFHCDSWGRYLRGASPFHYPGASETIYGIEKKLEYLDGEGVPIRHALLELSTALAGVTPRYDVTHRLPPALTGESWLDHQAANLKGYFTDFYFLKYMDYVARGRVDGFNRSVLGIARGDVHIDPATNDFYFAWFDRALAADSQAYYRSHPADFPPRDATPPPCADPAIGPEQRALLEKIQAIFKKHRTDVRIVLSPDYRQVCLAPADVAALKELFGADRVFDYTGVNPWTADRNNFYDMGHVRPEVADRILAEIYARR